MADKKKIGFFAGVCVAAVAIGGTIIFQTINKDPTTSYAAIIDQNFQAMGNSYDTKTLLSSSPYAYIDNEYYNNIVTLGFEAVPILQNKSENKEFSSLNSYISALAIQEITDCDLYEITGVDFETADEFYELWDETMQEIPQNLEAVAKNTEMTANDKKVEFERYGVFGEAFLKETIMEEKKQFAEENVNCKYTKKEKKQLTKLVKTGEEELEKVVEYLENYGEK